MQQWPDYKMIQDSKMLRNLLLFAVFMSPTIAAAKPPSLERLSEMAIAYVSQIGCVDPYTTINPENVTEFTDEEAQIKDAYIVMVPADLACAGGTGTSGSTLVLLEHAFARSIEDDPDFHYLRVNAAASEPVATSRKLNTITSVYQKNGQLFATALDHGNLDANCCPSVKILYKVSLRKNPVEIADGQYRTFYSWDFTLTGDDDGASTTH